MKKILLVTTVLIMILQSSIYGCWIGMTYTEMDQEADLIVIVEYRGGNEALLSTDEDQMYDMNYTLWQVYVKSVIKGDASSEITVATPGSAEAGVSSSIDYPLTNQVSGTFLLYLYENTNGYYEPLVPWAVVSLEQDHRGELLSKYNLLGVGEEERIEIIDLVQSREESVLMIEDEIVVASNPAPLGEAVDQGVTRMINNQGDEMEEMSFDPVPIMGIAFGVIVVISVIAVIKYKKIK